MAEFPPLVVGDGCEVVVDSVAGMACQPPETVSPTGDVVRVHQVDNDSTPIRETVTFRGVEIQVEPTLGEPVSAKAESGTKSTPAETDDDIPDDQEEGPGPELSETKTPEDWARQVLWAYDNFAAWPAKRKRDAP